MKLVDRIRKWEMQRQSRVHGKFGEVISKESTFQSYVKIKSYIFRHSSPQSVVALRGEHDWPHMFATLACMELGVPFLPLSPHWPDARIKAIQKQLPFDLELDQARLEKIINEDAAPSSPKAFERDGGFPLYTIFTSGSTGEPKGVVISRGAYENFVDWVDAYFNSITQDDSHLVLADFTFDMSMLDVALFITKQTAVFFTSFQSNYFRLALEITKYRPTVLVSVPGNINMLLGPTVFERANLSSLKHLLLGGSRFSLACYRSIFSKLKNGTRVYNLYGPTEATVYSHAKELTGNETSDLFDSNVSVGQPISNVECLLIDNMGKPIYTPHETGELLLGGIQVMNEYVSDSVRTRQSLLSMDDGVYYKTGDIAFIGTEGNYFIKGRKDDTLKRRGFRINLLDVDNYIQKISGVQEVATIALPREDTDSFLVTFIIARKTISIEVLRGEMKKVLVDYQIPDEIQFVDSFPLTQSGKICRKSLLEWYRRGSKIIDQPKFDLQLRDREEGL